MPTPDLLHDEQQAQAVLGLAAEHGFRLVKFETDLGQDVWEWRNGNQPRPRFATRRVALHWMTECLAREGRIAFVSDVGESYHLDVA
jgi:hypothetical protein